MRLFVPAAAAGAAALALAAQPAAAATLTHAYEFSGSTVTDSVGGADGQLIGDAHVAGGRLNLDGSGDYVQFGQDLIPTGGADFSLLLRVRIDPSQAGIAEIISQGYSGGTGFYVGPDGGTHFRLTDAYGGSGVPVPASATEFHNLFLTNGADGFNFSIDGVNVFSAAKVTNFNVDTHTRLGRQFGGYGEYFNGQYDTVKVWSGVATYAEATAAGGHDGVPEPATWAMMVIGFLGAGALLRRRQAASVA